MTGSAVGCGESDKYKNVFFRKILMRDLEVLRLVAYVWVVWRILTKFVKTKGTETWRKFGVAVLIFGDI